MNAWAALMVWKWLGCCVRPANAVSEYTTEYKDSGMVTCIGLWYVYWYGLFLDISFSFVML